MMQRTDIKGPEEPAAGTGRRILLTRQMPEPVMQRIRDEMQAWINPEDRQLSPAELQVAVAEHRPNALMVMATDQIDAGFIAAMPSSVRAIATLSVGHEHIDIEAVRAHGLALLHTPDIHSNAVSEMAILLMLCAARRAQEGERMIYEDRWPGWSPTQLLGRDLTGARLGIIGMGRIGRIIAHRARAGFDMRIHYHNRSRLPHDLEQGATYHGTAEDLLAVSDFLILSAPSSPQTRGFLNARTIAHLPEGAVVVNVARGDLIDDDALIAALRSGRIAAAGLDVFNGEPNIHPAYRTLPNVFLQPHQGSSSMETRVRMGHVLLDSVEAFWRGERLNRLI
ncbi:glyoxylate reductase [Roseovarius azorensis]|uniref:Glyoxylate reductase n=1 Tax=Roseovarius azorensis TaxID=1287727 RepID=A0A1H7QG42_9RHOB|nr:D-glycerate dehydrogenase [Roseovarius azorensis]SEL46718.1 glyoxylate reductase [Roseovarius azorensis]